MVRNILILVSIIFSTALSAQVADQWKIIHAGTLLSDAREDVRSEQSILLGIMRLWKYAMAMSCHHR